MLADAVELVPGLDDGFELAEKMPGFLQFVDPQIWQTTTTLPDTGHLPRRLMLCEFERVYIDRTVPHLRSGSI